MRSYVDTDLIVDFVKGNPPMSGRVLNHVLRAGVTTVVSDLTRMECIVLAARANDPVLRQDLDGFIAASDLAKMTSPVYVLAAEIQVKINCSPSNALHLAAAELDRCDEFVTNKRRLARWKGVRVHVL
jgi:predicted nucleic acid-binding protein